MLYIIFGTNIKKRELAKKKIKNILLKNKIDFESLLKVPKIDKDNYTLLPNYFSSSSLFGEKVLINIENILSQEDSRNFIYKNIEIMIKSDNVFLLDDPFGESSSFLKLERDLKKKNLEENIFDSREKIIKKDIEPFYLCELIERRDKKSAWQEWKKIYEEWKDEEAMALHGALWWKWKNIWASFLDENSKNYFKYKLISKNIKYSKEEIERFGEELAFMAMKANNGEQNLMRSIERFILKI